MIFSKTGLTLAELIISIALLGVIILAATTFDTAIRQSFRYSDIQAQLLTELSPTMQHMTKFIMQGVGRFGNPGVVINTANDILVRLDINRFTRVLNNTPWDYTDDTWVEYILLNQTICYYFRIDPWDGTGTVPTQTGPFEVIARRISAVQFNQPSPGVISINLTACQDPTGTCGTMQNPSVNLNTNISLRAESIN